MFRIFSLKTKCSREVMLDELKRSRALFLTNTLLTAKQWGNEDFLSKVEDIERKLKHELGVRQNSGSRTSKVCGLGNAA